MSESSSIASSSTCSRRSCDAVGDAKSNKIFLALKEIETRPEGKISRSQAKKDYKVRLAAAQKYSESLTLIAGLLGRDNAIDFFGGDKVEGGVKVTRQKLNEWTRAFNAYLSSLYKNLEDVLNNKKTGRVAEAAKVSTGPNAFDKAFGFDKNVISAILDVIGYDLPVFAEGVASRTYISVILSLYNKSFTESFPSEPHQIKVTRESSDGKSRNVTCINISPILSRFNAANKKKLTEALRDKLVVEDGRQFVDFFNLSSTLVSTFQQDEKPDLTRSLWEELQLLRKAASGQPEADEADEADDEDEE